MPKIFCIIHRFPINTTLKQYGPETKRIRDIVNPKSQDWKLIAHRAQHFEGDWHQSLFIPPMFCWYQVDIVLQTSIFHSDQKRAIPFILIPRGNPTWSWLNILHGPYATMGQFQGCSGGCVYQMAAFYKCSACFCM